MVVAKLVSGHNTHTVSLPITIGNRRASSQDCNPPPNLSHSNATVSSVMPIVPPPYPISNSLQGTYRDMQTEPRIMPSASPLPSSSVDMRPISSIDYLEVPNTPPPPYSEF